MIRATWLYLVEALAARIIAWAEAREPDFIIGDPEDPYMLRHYLFGSRAKPGEHRRRSPRSILGIRPYVHCVLRSDDDRAHHDHPNPSIGLCLRNRMLEHTIAAGGIHVRRRIEAGTVRYRSARFAHRLEIDAGPCWTLFVFFGPRREWGFHCPEKGWVHWKDFTNPADDGATVGRGCD